MTKNTINLFLKNKFIYFYIYLFLAALDLCY